MIKKIYCNDSMFCHAGYISVPDINCRKSDKIFWDFNVPDNTDELVVYTDNSIQDVKPPIENKIAWMIESPAITTSKYDWIYSNNNKFKYVITHNKKLLDKGENFVFAPLGGTWLWDDEICLYLKTKNISMVSSNKNFTLGHSLRQNIINMFGDKIDLFGNGFNPIDRKIKGLRDYRFSICVENTKEDYYFSEKLIDCFLSGTIPLYWGCPSISKFFDIDGILQFDNISDIGSIIDNCNDKLYEEMFSHVIKNFELAKDYIFPEEWIIKNSDVLTFSLKK